jgi:hypothetical protein
VSRRWLDSVHEVVPWVQQNLGIAPWVTIAMIVVSGIIMLLMAACKCLAAWTAIRSSDSKRRDDALRVLECLTRSRTRRPRRRNGKHL